MVTRTYERIRADPRHRAIVMLSSNEVQARAFGNWAMADDRVALVEGEGSVIEQVDRLTDKVGDPNMQAMFRSFARVRAAA